MSIMQTLKKKGLEILESLSSGKLRMIYDGNMAQAYLRSYEGAKCVGTDEHGNKYYFQPTASYQNTRWVIYKDMKEKEISTIPPEWSHWLNYMSDDIPGEGDMSGKRPKFFVTREAFVTGDRPYMMPKGSWLNPEKRNWKKVSYWEPPKGSTVPKTN